MYNEYEEKIEKLNKEIEDLKYQLKQHELLAKENAFKMQQLMEDNAKLNAQLKNKISYSKTQLEKVQVPAYDVKVGIQQGQYDNPNRTSPAITATATPALYRPPTSTPPPQTRATAQTPPPQSSPVNQPRDTQPPRNPQGQRVLHTAPMISQNMSTGTLKRICPNCGAMGFAIKEIEDKTKIISYVPRRIYAKKKVCTKCFLEF
ncbi:MAG: hypothetical protein ACFFAS_17020 [Promethearchaeota archaeon]